jgi:hypothetical protein
MGGDRLAEAVVLAIKWYCTKLERSFDCKDALLPKHSIARAGSAGMEGGCSPQW